MQAKGPDGEICYFTQINSDLPGFTLPRARCPIDRLFINVLASSDMRNAQRWMVRHLGFAVGRESMEIVYTMLAAAFGTPPEDLYTISTMVHGTDVFLEVDQMPAVAKPRPRHPSMLPPGVAITTFRVPDLDAVSAPSSRHPVATTVRSMAVAEAARSPVRTARCSNWSSAARTCRTRPVAMPRCP